MRLLTTLLFLIAIISCNETSVRKEKTITAIKKENKNSSSKNKKVIAYYESNKGNDLESVSTGSPSNGKIENAKLLPFYGNNFEYFSELSYLAGRAFVNNRVRDLLIESFDSLKLYFPSDTFYIMETSHQMGGKFFPHRTHQNGLSVDLMMPYLKNNTKYTALDHLGILHYQLEFNNDATWEKDKNVTPDFEKIALQLHVLNQLSKKNGLMISKVIIKTEWIKLLLTTVNAKKYNLSQLPFVYRLEEIVNKQHDDHFHVDFRVIK